MVAEGCCLASYPRKTCFAVQADANRLIPEDSRPIRFDGLGRPSYGLSSCPAALLGHPTFSLPWG